MEKGRRTKGSVAWQHGFENVERSGRWTRHEPRRLRGLRRPLVYGGFLDQSGVLLSCSSATAPLRRPVRLSGREPRSDPRNNVDSLRADLEKTSPDGLFKELRTQASRGLAAVLHALARLFLLIFTIAAFRIAFSASTRKAWLQRVLFCEQGTRNSMHSRFTCRMRGL